MNIYRIQSRYKNVSMYINWGHVQLYVYTIINNATYLSAKALDYLSDVHIANDHVCTWRVSI